MKITNSVIGDFSGTVGGMTFYLNAGKQVARKANSRLITISPGALLIKFVTAQASAIWRGFPPEVKATWVTLATTHGKKSGFMFFKTCFLRVNAFSRNDAGNFSGIDFPSATYFDVVNFFGIVDFTEPDYNFIIEMSPVILSFLASVQRTGYGSPYNYKIYVEITCADSLVHINELASLTGKIGLSAEVTFTFKNKKRKKIVFSLPITEFTDHASIVSFTFDSPNIKFGISNNQMDLCTGWRVDLFLSEYGHNWTRNLVSSDTGKF